MDKRKMKVVKKHHSVKHPSKKTVKSALLGNQKNTGRIAKAYSSNADVFLDA